MNIQRIALLVFFPAMFFCAGSALFGLWAGDTLNDDYFRVIPTFFIVGLAALITWAVATIMEFKNIAKAIK